VADLPIRLADPELQAQLHRAADPDGRIPRAVEALRSAEPATLAYWPLSDGLRENERHPYRDPAHSRLAELEAGAVPAGRIIIVEDYGRDDVTALLGGPDRGRHLVAWSRRGGPFLSRGYRIRVLHCWWQWSGLDEAQTFLAAAFDDRGAEVAKAMRRPRLTWKVALYHRGTGEPHAPAGESAA
jgi:hypothetical protein